MATTAQKMRNDTASQDSLESITLSFHFIPCCLFGDYASEIVAVADGYEQMFWDYVNRDPLNYYFFILDWTMRRE